MLTLSSEEFEQLVSVAYADLPPVFRTQLDNVAIVVEGWPDVQTLQSVGLTHRAELLGLYHGIPLTERTHDYGMVTPDVISIYRQPILLQCENVEQARALVVRVLRHEVAHYFGIDDERLEALGAY